ncbi:hypothetical protein CYLTODRAFT_416943 [Cylindrobasidium torrendii FP15055 ss-10]|uniref:ZZ-type domain-containing protein n=1 Tax=Cylindrobasidium torrendii FP15055 ss-10 TaxID=1314674 RepID=A0A0D7BTR3_9AGAR|nr:hypothetical protein CYLTODRAFT_416943 [Cylindrobasidium torrendii FP15055 ss-10]
MFNVKATYRGETRKFSFEDSTSFPSFAQLYNQLNQIFPHLGRNFYLKQLLFSADGSDARILIGREVHDAKEYSQRLANPSIGGPWPNPLLKFDVFDDTPAGSEREHPYGFIPWRTPPALPPLPPLHHISLPSFPHTGNGYGHSHGPMPPPPPPPVLFPSPGMAHPTDTDKGPHHFMSPPVLPPMWPHRHYSMAQSQSQTACCSVSAARQDVSQLISDFKKDLDDVVADLSPSPASPSSNNKCTECDMQSLAMLPACLTCSAVLCSNCRTSSSPGCTGFGHTFPSPHPGSWPPVTRPMSFAEPPTPVTPFIPPPCSPPPIIPTMDGWPHRAPQPPTGPAAVIHHGVICDSCNTTIEGVRHKCLDCSNFDLCSRCISEGGAETHNAFHEFIDIREPGRVVVHVVGDRNTDITPPAAAAAQEDLVHNATCDMCDSRIRGQRYKCTSCPDFDTCGACFAITPEQHPRHSFVRIADPSDLITTELSPRRQHHASCNVCGIVISGIRYKCLHATCPDFDLCEGCEALPISQHPENHPMLKMRDPETIIPTVYRVGGTTLIEHEERGRSEDRAPPSRMSTPLSYQTRSPSRESTGWGIPGQYPPPMSIPGQYPFALRTPSPPLMPIPVPPLPSPPTLVEASSPPPVPPKAWEYGHSMPAAPPIIVPQASWEKPAHQSYRPQYDLTRSFFRPTESANRHPFRRPESPPLSYNPMYLNTADYLSRTPSPSALGDIAPRRSPSPDMLYGRPPSASILRGSPSPDFFRNTVFGVRRSPSPPSASEDPYERAVVQYPPLNENSSVPNLRRKLSFDDQELRLPEAPKFSPFSTPKPEPVAVSVHDSPPVIRYDPFLSSPVAPVAPKLDAPPPLSFTDLIGLLQAPPATSPRTTEGDTFLTPASENPPAAVSANTTITNSFGTPSTILYGESPRPSFFNDTPMSTPLVATREESPKGHTHSLLELLNDVMNKDQRPLDIPTPTTATPVIESMPTPREPLIAAWRTPKEEPAQIPQESVLPYAADFVEDVTVADGQVFPPGAEFVKSWRMKNSGRDWDESTRLVFVAGESFNPAGVNVTSVDVGSVKSGEEIDLYTGELKAPDLPGRYVGYWRLKNSTTHLFGASIWIDITVAEHNNLSEQMSSPSGMSNSSVIMMPSGVADASRQMHEPMSMSTTAAVTAASSGSDSTASDIISLDGSDDSFSGVSVPDSDEDWEDGRANASTGQTAGGADEFVVLYDDEVSSEDSDA